MIGDICNDFRRESDELEHQTSFETEGEGYDDSKDAQGRETFTRSIFPILS
jgi:hypothetical protein